MKTTKTNTAKKIITGVLGIPVALVMMGELTDLSYWWVQVGAAVIMLALMAWWGALKPTKYDSDGYAIER